MFSLEIEGNNLPSHWRVQTVNETQIQIGDGNYSSKYPKQSELLESGIPFVSSNNLIDGKISSTNLRYISEEQHSRLLKGHVKENDVIIVVRGNGVGDVALVDKKYDGVNINAQLAYLRQNDFVFGKFLYYQLKNNKEKGTTEKYVSGSAQPQITVGTINQFILVLPTVKEQIQIASILNSLDDKIDLLHRQNNTLEQLAETLFRQSFVEESEENWNVNILGKLGKVVTGKTPKTAHKEYWGIDIPFITPTDFKNFGKYISSADRFLSILGMKSVNNNFISKGSILVTCIGSDMGKVAITLQPSVTNQQINSLIINNNFPSPEYIYQYLKSIYPLLRSMASSGSTMPIINKSDFENIEITIPPEDILIKFETITSSFNKKILSNTQLIHTLTHLRDTLLPKLMSGEVRVNNFKN